MELWKLTASELAARIRERAVSSSEVLESHLERIEASNGVLNALVSVNATAARAAAREADRAVARGDELGPLHGVPVSIKVNTDQVGEATTDGRVALAADVAPRDASVRLISAHPGPCWSGGATFRSSRSDGSRTTRCMAGR